MQLSNVKMKLQCDQMATLFVQYLGIYNNVNLPKSINKLPDKAQKFAKYHLNLQKWRKAIKFFPKYQNFAKSGHTDWKVKRS